MNVQINRKKVSGIINTGVTANCCSHELATRVKLEIIPDKTQIMQVDTITYPLGTVNVKVRVEGQEEQTKLFIIRNLGWDLLIGLDLGQKFKLVIFLEELKVLTAPRVTIKHLSKLENSGLTSEQNRETNNLLRNTHDIITGNRHSTL